MLVNSFSFFVSINVLGIKLFKNGIISFSDGEQSIHNFTISGQGFNKFDGTSIICEIRTPLDHMINAISLPSFKSSNST